MGDAAKQLAGCLEGQNCRAAAQHGQITSNLSRKIRRFLSGLGEFRR
jgi:hypothetical protein